MDRPRLRIAQSADEPASKREGLWNELDYLKEYGNLVDFSSQEVQLQVELEYLPPNPVAKPTVPSDASISTRNDPRTLMPQLVRDLRYWVHCEAGVEISLSMSLRERKGD